MPDFSYFLYDNDRSIENTDPTWSAPLPLNRTDFLRKSEGHHAISEPTTHGEYFKAATQFLKKDNFSSLCCAVSEFLNQEIKPQHINQIKVFLEKHGRFYHPARVVTELSGQEISFVLNVAVTDMGHLWIQNEFQILKELNHRYTYTSLPRVYDYGEVGVESGNPKISMFLGEWFEDHHEFHLSWDQKTQKYRIMVWDPVGEKFFLSNQQTFELYRQASKILTQYYDVETHEQIFPWHHGAGDFIIEPSKETLDLKLITVRQYAPLTENTDTDATSILNGLILFFLNLTIWMRLDREDGVGDILWADDMAVEAAIQGCFEGLKKKSQVKSMDEPVLIGFQKYLSAWKKTEFLDLLEYITSLYHPHTPEIPIIQKHLEEHAEMLINTLKTHQIDPI